MFIDNLFYLIKVENAWVNSSSRAIFYVTSQLFSQSISFLLLSLADHNFVAA